MPRIAGVDINENRRVDIALTGIYGIGRTNVKQVLIKAEIDPSIRVAKLTETEIGRLQKTIESLSQFSGWFPYVMKAEKPGSSITFKFDGTMLGIFDIGGPEVGQIELELDGVQMNLEEKSPINYRATQNKADSKTINRFNKFCNNRYRGQCVFIRTEPGNHQVVIEISAEMPDKTMILEPSQLSDIRLNPMKYNRSVIYLGKILIRGNVLE